MSRPQPPDRTPDRSRDDFPDRAVDPRLDPRSDPSPDRSPWQPTRSAVALHGHPLHPMLVVFPIAFLSTVPLTDLVHLWWGEPFWARVSFWLCVGGLGGGLAAAAAGTADLLLLRRARRLPGAWSHFVVAVMALALAAAGVWLRAPDPVAATWPWGLMLSMLTVGVVAVAGWLGGSLSFHHGIGVYGAPDAAGPRETTGADHDA